MHRWVFALIFHTHIQQLNSFEIVRNLGRYYSGPSSGSESVYVLHTIRKNNGDV